MEQYETNRKQWYESRKIDIFLTAVLPALLGLAGAVVNNLEWKIITDSTVVKNLLSVHLLQAVFILVTLFVLNRCRCKTLNDASDRPTVLKFIRRVCNLRDEGDDSLNSSYHVAYTTIKQFFRVWMIIWCLWFAYYLGYFIFEYNFALYHSVVNTYDCMPQRISELFSNTLDFLSSAALFVVYLILNEVTVFRDKRNLAGKSILDGQVILVVVFMLFVAPSLFALYTDTAIYNKIMVWVSLLLAVVSTVSFVMILGKLNSYYLQIPGILLYGLYFYAAAQAFEPLAVIYDHYLQDSCCCMQGLASITGSVGIILPWLTLIGKIFLMLTLIWITEEKRFVLFVVHRSQSITDSVKLLKVFNMHYMK